MPLCFLYSFPRYPLAARPGGMNHVYVALFRRPGEMEPMESMVLTREDRLSLRRAREARRTEEFLERYHAKIESSRAHHERNAEQREPSLDRMKETFNF